MISYRTRRIRYQTCFKCFSTAIISVVVLTSGLSVGYAADTSQNRHGGEAQPWQSEQLQEQLQKARQAAQATVRREQKVLSRQQAPTHSKRAWQSQQQDKARLQFQQRADREQRYLRQAKQAAQQQNKIAPRTGHPEPVSTSQQH
ncbi:hypothetical protein NFHSH190041_34070 [Shewanella sp. NFH-SH190041]|uniref:hypothetical protein n=1 Tax=Shewanella sp. NFH-SH190041 TaxID=2950245 RepID=UPI0021C4AB58|nr:hypothetical protein [Shewanella sp. NFH-SH190041]BDM65955.1 hypothetical protein NFHSH190041_34070 [Shewanella sp. NFH-SH190041]